MDLKPSRTNKKLAKQMEVMKKKLPDQQKDNDKDKDKDKDNDSDHDKYI